jgi:hypothetical protein
MADKPHKPRRQVSTSRVYEGKGKRQKPRYGPVYPLMGQVNMKAVEDILFFLVESYEKFITTYPDQVKAVDGWLAVQNFHRMIIEDIAHDAEDAKPGTGKMVRTLAVRTFAASLRDEDEDEEAGAEPGTVLH